MNRSTPSGVRVGSLWTAALFTWATIVPVFPSSAIAQPRAGNTQQRIYRFDTMISPDVSSIAYVQITEFFNAILEVSDQVHVLQDEDLIIEIDRREIAKIVKNKGLDDADKLVFKGKDAIQDHRYKRAVIHLKKAIGLYEKNFVDLVDYDKLVDAWMQMSIATWRGKYREDAEAALDRVLSMRPATQLDPKKHDPEFLDSLKKVRSKQGSFYQGQVSVDSTPSSATILVDGIPSGRTPGVLTNLRKGKHYIQLRREGYKPWGRKVKTPAKGEKKSLSGVLTQSTEQNMADVEGEYISPDSLMGYAESGNFGANFQRAARYFCAKAYVNFLIYTYISRSEEEYGLHVFLYNASVGKTAALEPVRIDLRLTNLQVVVLELAQELENALNRFPSDRVLKTVPPKVYREGYEKMLAGVTPESARKKREAPPPPPPPAPLPPIAEAPIVEMPVVVAAPPPAPAPSPAPIEPEASGSLDELFADSGDGNALFTEDTSSVSQESRSWGDDSSAGDTQFYEEWWFWTAVGVGLAGAGVGTAWALGAFDSDEPPLFTGTVTFP